MLSYGISMETLSKMLGHSNIGTTQVYGKITDHKIQEDMTALKYSMLPVCECSYLATKNCL